MGISDWIGKGEKAKDAAETAQKVKEAADTLSTGAIKDTRGC